MTDFVHGFKTAELLVAPPRNDHGLRNMLHTLPKGKGWVFGLVIIDTKDEEGRERIAHIVASHLEHLAGELTGDANGPRRFEQMLAELNADLLRATEELHLRFDHFHGVVGLLAKNQLFLSGVGKVSALFLHKTADRRYSVYELDAQFQEGRADDDKRFFLTILDGEIHNGDVFYIGTPLPPHAISTNDLHDILVTLPPAGALQRIRQFVPPAQHYGALGFSYTEEESPSGQMKKANPIGSLEEFQTTQERTATVLGESNAELSNLVKNAAYRAKKLLASPGSRGAAAFAKRALALIITGLGAMMTMFVHWAKKGLAAAEKIFANIFLTSSLKEGKSSRLSPQKKLMVVGIFACTVIGLGLIFLSKGNAEKKAAAEKFDETVTQIEERITAAEASLIYRNTEEARSAVNEALSILETLPRDTSKEQSEGDRLSAKLVTLQDSLRGITTVSLQTLASRNDPSASPFTSSINLNGKLYAFANNLDTFRLDALNGSLVQENVSKGTLEAIKGVTTEGTNALVLDQNKQLGRADFTSETLNPITSGTNTLLSAEDIFTYGGNLYALSAESEQIIKMRPLGASYEAGTAWITSKNSDLSSARALAVDGDLFILTANTVIKMHSGKEIDWKPETIDPPLANPIDLWTDVTSSSLYILDSGASRVIVLNKDTGALVAQYTAPEMQNAIGFSVEENANRILIVTNDSVFVFTADHLLK